MSDADERHAMLVDGAAAEHAVIVPEDQWRRLVRTVHILLAASVITLVCAVVAGVLLARANMKADQVAAQAARSVEAANDAELAGRQAGEIAARIDKVVSDVTGAAARAAPASQLSRDRVEAMCRAILLDACPEPPEGD